MRKVVTNEIRLQIKLWREKGWSIPEIKKQTKLSYGTIHRYIKDIKILPEYRLIWLKKRASSIKRKEVAMQIATKKASSLIRSLSEKEKLIFLAALYWGEGSKSDFGLSNTDPQLIRVFIKILRDNFKINNSDLRISIRIYEDMNRNICLKYWSNITGIKMEEFVNVNVLKGKKMGKLQYGMCRVRVKRAGNLLKYITAIYKKASSII